jgi:integrase/recombinase XerD
MWVRTWKSLQPVTSRTSFRVRDYVDAAGIGKKGSCHLFRHTMATLMLEGGADTRFIQQMLGHENLASTQLYTQVSIRKLKEIHTATHPGAKLVRKGKDQGAEDRADVDPAEVLARLDEEAEEDGDD